MLSYAVFGKTIENVRKHRNIKLVTTERKINYLATEPNYHTTKFISNRNEKSSNNYKYACLFRVINIIFKWNCNVWTLLYYVKPKYGENAKL